MARRTLAAVVGIVAVGLVLAASGFLFATSAATARGTDLRAERSGRLVDLIREREGAHDDRLGRVGALREEVDRLTDRAADSDASVAAVQAQAEALALGAGTTALTGPGLTVSLDDAPRDPGEPLPDGLTPDDLVVHQQDVQAVINAMWTGGAEAIRVMDQRLISTEAVRCVGNTLILGGRVYSPPFEISAVGDVDALRQALDDAPGVRVYREWVEAVGLGYEVTDDGEVDMPAFEGALDLVYARVPE